MPTADFILCLLMMIPTRYHASCQRCTIQYEFLALVCHNLLLVFDDASSVTTGNHVRTPGLTYRDSLVHPGPPFDSLPPSPDHSDSSILIAFSFLAVIVIPPLELDWGPDQSKSSKDSLLHPCGPSSTPMGRTL
jgi:hypothetical protein